MASAMANATATSDLPPLPEYTLQPVPSMLPFISDLYMLPLVPIIAYWSLSLVFHIIDIYDLFPQYRLHTPEEISSRNHASRWEVFRDTVMQHVIQFFANILLSHFDAPDFTGKEDYDVAVWAQRVRLAQRGVPAALGLLGINAASISETIATSHPLLAGALAGGHYPMLTTTLDAISGTSVPAFAAWELAVAKLIYWIVIPGVELFIGMMFQDMWQYAIHRAMHMNHWLYTNWHSRHHRLYVPYAYGALYNHPAEAFFLDCVGGMLSYKISMMPPRLGMMFFAFSSLKVVDDHSGYALPWDPLQHITSNNAAYHDIHHQTWGIKSNFSQPFFTFWDSWLGTKWQGDTTTKYARDRDIATRKAARAAEAKAKAAEAKAQ